MQEYHKLLIHFCLWFLNEKKIVKLKQSLHTDIDLGKVLKAVAAEESEMLDCFPGQETYKEQVVNVSP